jgi:hypothetical protein
MIVKSSYYYAKNSIVDKQELRYNTAVANFKDFIKVYTKSQYRSELEKINSLSLQSLKKIASHDAN